MTHRPSLLFRSPGEGFGIQKKHLRRQVLFLLEAPPGFEPGVKDLQSHALPLGYGAVVGTGLLRFAAGQRLCRCPPAPHPRPRSSSQIQNCVLNLLDRGCPVRYMNFCSAEQKKWSGRRGSNSLPPPWQGGALPDELRPHIASGSLQMQSGASGRNRTNDTRIFSPLLYHLSYRGV